MKKTTPLASYPLISTIRVEGRPSAPTVARVIAFGSGSSAATACANQTSNCRTGSVAADASSSESRS